MKRAIDVAPFDELADPRLLADLAARAEERGWDGFFVWDHVAYRPPVRAVADPWVTLSAIACNTRSLRIGTMVTPLSRRRVQKLASQGNGHPGPPQLRAAHPRRRARQRAQRRA